MIELKGIPASPGVAIGRAIIYRRDDARVLREKATDLDEEISRLFKALELSKIQIKKLREEAEKSAGEKEAAIFDAHLMILEDKMFIDKIIKLIREKSLSAERAVKEASEDIIRIFESMESEYFKSRADDIRDLSRRIIENLMCDSPTSPELEKPGLEKPGIVAASELYPSDVIKMRNQKVIGLITEKGGIMSHAAIIARAMKIPAVVGIKGLMENLKDGDLLLVDGTKGIVLINPDEEVIEKYSDERARKS